MSKIDYAFKCKVLNEHQDLLRDYNKISKYTYHLNQLEDFGLVSPFLKREYGKVPRLNQAYDYYAKKGLLNEFLECSKISKATRQRTNRLALTISSMLDKAFLLDEKCLFLTLTFTNKCLDNSNAQSRRKFVTRWLKKWCDIYVANIDFGKRNGREHYHAVVLPYSKIDFATWIYGSCNFEYIHTPNTKALAKYTSKLTNHAIKETTKRCATIYSRN